MIDRDSPEWRQHQQDRYKRRHPAAHCTRCGTGMATERVKGAVSGTCLRCQAQIRSESADPVPGTRALRRMLFGQRRSRAGRLGPADRRRAAMLGVSLPPRGGARESKDANPV